MSVQSDLSTLPAEVRALFERALSLSAQWPEDASLEELKPARAVFAEGMEALGLGLFSVQADGLAGQWSSRPIARAEDLTAPQRELVTALVDRSDLFANKFQVPGTTWSRQQWLGLVPPGPLWQPDDSGQPRFFGLRDLAIADRRTLHAHLRTLAAEVRAPILAELDLVVMDCFGLVADLINETIVALDDSLGPWAIGFAERLLAGVSPYEFNRHDGDRRRLVYGALVKAGVPIEPRFDALLSLAAPRVPGLRDAWIEAIPEARREAAVVAALDSLNFPTQKVLTAAALLQRWPFVELALYAESHLSELTSGAKDVKKQLKDAADAHPPIKAALVAWRKSQPKPMNLKVVSKTKLADLLPLSPAQAAQLERAALEYNGEVSTAAQILAGECAADEVIVPDSIEYFRIEGPKGKPVYTLWGMMADSGTFFPADTTEVVARICQFSVEGDEKQLVAALQLALSEAS